MQKAIRELVQSKTCRSSEVGIDASGNESRTALEAAADSQASDSDDPPSSHVNLSVNSCGVELSLRTADTDPPMAGYVDRLLAHASAIANAGRGSLNVAIVDDPQMARLHKQYKGIDGSTDVLTFDLRPSATAPLEADIVICLDVAKRQAAKRGHPARTEVLLYALHGLLHLLGMDDDEPAKALAMHEREDEILTAIGVGPVYQVSEGSR